MLTINLSKLRRDGEGTRLPRNLVLTCTSDEASDVRALLYQNILQPAGRGVLPPTWSQDRETARFPLDVNMLEDVQLLFPHASTSPGLHTRMMRAVRIEYEEQVVPEVTVPGLNGTLMGHQKIAVHDINKWYNGEVQPITMTTGEIVGGDDPTTDCYFLNDEMGLGKTLVALCVDRLRRRATRTERGEREFRTLVVVPNSIKYPSWQKDMDEFFPNLYYQIIDSDRQEAWERAEIVLDSDTPVVIVNWESLWRISEIMDVEWDLVIADEYHRAKNTTSRQSMAFREIKFKKALFMSGTGILNGRPEELWPVLNRAWPERFPDLRYFMAQHIIRQRGSRVTAYRGLGELRDIVRSCETRRRKDQVMRDLPEKVYNRILVPMSAEQRRIYDRILDELVLEREDENGGKHYTPVVNILSQLTRLKQASWGPELFEGAKKSAKVDEVKRIVEEMTAQGEKVIIFSQWATATRILKRELAQYNPAYIDGKVKNSLRADEVHKFQTDQDCQVFIGTIGSCKEGLTLTAGSNVIFTDKGWTPAENEQAAARAHRIGQHRTVHVIEIFTTDSIEADLEDMLQSKQNVFNNLMERDGGQANVRTEHQDIRSLLEGVMA